MKHIRRFNEDNVYLIDKDTNEYFGKFKDIEAAEKAIETSYKPEDNKIVTGTDEDFELKKDKDGYIKKFYKK